MFVAENDSPPITERMTQQIPEPPTYGNEATTVNERSMDTKSKLITQATDTDNSQVQISSANLIPVPLNQNVETKTTDGQSSKFFSPLPFSQIANLNLLEKPVLPVPIKAKDQVFFGSPFQNIMDTSNGVTNLLRTSNIMFDEFLGSSSTDLRTRRPIIDINLDLSKILGININ